jgi:hypothetical protein
MREIQVVIQNEKFMGIQDGFLAGVECQSDLVSHVDVKYEKGRILVREIYLLGDIPPLLIEKKAARILSNRGMKMVTDFLMAEPTAGIAPIPIGIESENRLFSWNNDVRGCQGVFALTCCHLFTRCHLVNVSASPFDGSGDRPASPIITPEGSRSAVILISRFPPCSVVS